jgi:hypothetical protein
MKTYFLLSACVAIVAAALVAGCGGGDSTSAPATVTEATTPTSTSTSSSTTTEASGQATPDDVYNACLDAIEGTAAEQAAQAGCAQARDAFEQCATAAENTTGSAQETAIKACQDAANRATQALESAAP